MYRYVYASLSVAKKLVDIKKIFSVERLPPYLVSATALTAATEPNTLEVNTATLSVTSFGARSSDVILQTTAATPEMFTPEVGKTYHVPSRYLECVT